MANVGIEKQDVFGAADEILAGGKEPTIQAIREKLGTGSLTTISKHLKDWQASKRNQSPVAKAPLITARIELKKAAEMFSGFFVCL